MDTIKLSPRQLAGLPEPFRRGLRVGDGVPFGCGDLVVDEADERHVGEIRAIQSSAYATILWLESGWRSYHVPLRRLRKVTD
jgi:hypothetical protein